MVEEERNKPRDGERTIPKRARLARGFADRRRGISAFHSRSIFRDVATVRAVCVLTTVLAGPLVSTDRANAANLRVGRPIAVRGHRCACAEHCAGDCCCAPKAARQGGSDRPISTEADPASLPRFRSNPCDSPSGPLGTLRSWLDPSADRAAVVSLAIEVRAEPVSPSVFLSFALDRFGRLERPPDRSPKG